VLGRSIGLTEEQMAHLGGDPLPDGLYSPAQAAIVRYAQKSTRLERIDDETYGALAQHFTPEQIVDICLTVGLSNMVNRFHATFQTDLDAETTAEAERGDAIFGSCPIRRPPPPR
jgi:alkylhydroperoxidase family enzyme